LTVWPRPADVAISVRLHADARPATDFSAARLTSEGEFAGVRAYRRGDAMRSIHWQQTARHDRLIVRERAESNRQICRVRLDTRRSSYPDAATFELAVSIAAGVVEQAARERVELELAAGRSRAIVGDAASRDAAMDLLAAVIWSAEDAPPPLSGSGLVITTRRGLACAKAGRVTPLIVEDSCAGGGGC
jgi:uncharacterized protein (DUF58 family)